jgi:hypothetical protein
MRSTFLQRLAVLTAILSVTGEARAVFVVLQDATATFSQSSFGGQPVGQAIDGNFGNRNGWAIYEGTNAGGGLVTDLTNPQTAAFETASDVGFAGGTTLTFFLHQLFLPNAENGGHNIGRFRLSFTTDARSEFADGLPTGGDVSANWVVVQPLSAAATNGATLSVLGDGSVLAGGPNPATSVYTVTASTSLSGITGFRLEVFADPSLPDSGPGRFANGNFVLTEFQVDASQAVSGVPEPLSLTLLGVGLVSLLAVRRGRRA